MKKLLLIFAVLLFVFPLITNAQDPYHWRRIIDKATFDICVNPRNTNTYYAGGEGRLVYRSYDGGNHWDTLVVNFRQGYSRFNNVVIHPIDTNIIIIGGLNFGILERCTGDCDNPDNWKVVLSSYNPVALNGKSMVFKPDQPDTVYAGDFMYGIVWRSTNKGETWEKSSDVHPEKKEYSFVCRYENDVIYITPNIQITGSYKFFLFNVLGDIISEKNISFEGKSNEKSVDIPKVNNGFYFWILSNGLIRYSSSFIIY